MLLNMQWLTVGLSQPPLFCFLYPAPSFGDFGESPALGNVL
jgi:hypothetical protein